MSTSDYSSENAKWKAYQFQDPYAEGVFYVGYRASKKFCSPSCDLKDPIQDKSSIVYFNNASEAIDQDFIPCAHCNPLDVNQYKKKLVMMCIDHINQLINFNPPMNLFDEANLSNDSGTISSNNSSNSNTNNSTTNNHIVTIIACRHIAAAAANSFLNSDDDISPNNSAPTSPTSAATVNTNKKRRKRGGVVGFKELAAKSKLSPWHFHRVFKSITGLTPKAYGDKCSEFIKNVRENETPSGAAVGNQFVTLESQNINDPLTTAAISTLPQITTTAVDGGIGSFGDGSHKLYIDHNNNNYNMTPHRHSIVTTATSQSFDSQILDNPNSFSPTEFESASPISSYLSTTNNQFFTTPQDNNYNTTSSLNNDQLIDLELLDYVKNPTTAMPTLGAVGNNSISGSNNTLVNKPLNESTYSNPSFGMPTTMTSDSFSSNNNQSTQGSTSTNNSTFTTLSGSSQSQTPPENTINLNKVNPASLDFNLYLSDFGDMSGLNNFGAELNDLNNDAFFNTFMGNSLTTDGINKNTNANNTTVNNKTNNINANNANAPLNQLGAANGLTNDFVFI